MVLQNQDEEYMLWRDLDATTFDATAGEQLANLRCFIENARGAVLSVLSVLSELHNSTFSLLSTLCFDLNFFLLFKCLKMFAKEKTDRCQALNHVMLMIDQHCSDASIFRNVWLIASQYRT